MGVHPSIPFWGPQSLTCPGRLVWPPFLVYMFLIGGRSKGRACNLLPASSCPSASHPPQTVGAGRCMRGAGVVGIFPHCYTTRLRAIN